MTKIDVENVKTMVSQNKIIGKDIFYFIKTKSTMDEAHKAVSKQIGEGSVFIAEEQTAGRGRFKRKWISDQGANLTFSILLKPEISKMRLINMATALAISSGIHLITGIKTTLKWPNDVRINKKKVAGILIESGYDKENNLYMVVGIGINVNMRIDEHSEIKSFATSLSNELGEEVERINLFVSILNSIDAYYQKLDCSDEIRTEWINLLDTLGTEINFLVGESIVVGHAESVDEDGNLIIRKKDGEIAVFSAGEVTLQT